MSFRAGKTQSQRRVRRRDKQPQLRVSMAKNRRDRAETERQDVFRLRFSWKEFYGAKNQQ